MRSVKGRDTGPEMLVRRTVHGMGYRYRLHQANLPGKPDLVFPSHKKVIFVHGCFWHGHDCARGARIPKSNRDYWLKKIERNRQRDLQSGKELTKSGWLVLTIWECQMKDREALKFQLSQFLSNAKSRKGL